ncbi:MAG: hypothetical protein WAZ34_08985, partial [Rhodocyclaceae bacterium]
KWMTLRNPLFERSIAEYQRLGDVLAAHGSVGVEKYHYTISICTPPKKFNILLGLLKPTLGLLNQEKKLMTTLSRCGGGTIFKRWCPAGLVDALTARRRKRTRRTNTCLVPMTDEISIGNIFLSYIPSRWLWISRMVMP